MTVRNFWGKSIELEERIDKKTEPGLWTEEEHQIPLAGKQWSGKRVTNQRMERREYDL